MSKYYQTNLIELRNLPYIGGNPGNPKESAWPNSTYFVKKTVLVVCAFFSVVLLIIFFAAFFLLGNVPADTVPLPVPAIAGYQPVLSMASLRVLLGGGIVMLQFIVIVLAVAGRALDVIRVFIRPIAVLIPLVMFVSSAYQTFSLVAKSTLPTEITGASTDFAATVNQAEFSQSVLWTFGTMMLFLLFTQLFGAKKVEVKKKAPSS